MTAIEHLPVGIFSGKRGITEQPTVEVQRALVGLLNLLADGRNQGPIEVGRHVQAVAATSRDPLFIAPAAGELIYVAVAQVIVGAADEWMQFCFLRNGTSVLRFDADPIVLGAFAGIAALRGVINFPDESSFVSGDVFEIDRVYIPGGAPGPMAYTVGVLGYRLAPS